MKKILNFLKKNKYLLSLISVLVLVYIIFDKLYLNKENFENRELISFLENKGISIPKDNEKKKTFLLTQKIIWLLDHDITKKLTSKNDFVEEERNRIFLHIKNYKGDRPNIDQMSYSLQYFYFLDLKIITTILQGMNKNNRIHNFISLINKESIMKSESLRFEFIQEMFNEYSKVILRHGQQSISVEEAEGALHGLQKNFIKHEEDLKNKNKKLEEDLKNTKKNFNACNNRGFFTRLFGN